ncbi:MAG: hypothetical protein IJ745_08170 [Bacteroidales bacterium]|nr:hypothetical protein [Bacteroidales bacterium]
MKLKKIGKILLLNISTILIAACGGNKNSECPPRTLYGADTIRGTVITDDEGLFVYTKKVLDSAFTMYVFNLAFALDKLGNSVLEDNKEEALKNVAVIDSLYDDMAETANAILLMWAYRPIRESTVGEYLGRENGWLD